MLLGERKQERAAHSVEPSDGSVRSSIIEDDALDGA